MIRALLSSLSLMLCLGLVGTAHADDVRPEVAGFSLKTLKGGKKVSLSQFKGKVVVVNFWASWCEPCKQELPFLNQYYKDLKDDGLVVLAIATDGPRTLSKVRQTVKRKKWKMPILLDLDGSVMGDLNPRGAAPYTLYVDREGRNAGDHDGYAPGDEIKMLAKIKTLLAEGQATKTAPTVDTPKTEVPKQP